MAVARNYVTKLYKKPGNFIATKKTGRDPGEAKKPENLVKTGNYAYSPANTAIGCACRQVVILI